MWYIFSSVHTDFVGQDAQPFCMIMVLFIQGLTSVPRMTLDFVELIFLKNLVLTYHEGAHSNRIYNFTFLRAKLWHLFTDWSINGLTELSLNYPGQIVRELGGETRVLQGNGNLHLSAWDCIIL